MLKQRIITAGILLPLVIAAILFLPANAIEIISAGLFLLAAFEWSNLMLINNKLLQWLVAGLLFVVGVGLWRLDISGYVLSAFAVCWWFFAAITIWFYPHGKSFWSNNFVSFIVGTLLLIPSWFALNLLVGDKNFGPIWLLLVLSIVWGADIGAYFFGKKWGKTKLAPNLSPKKTLEGVFGGLVFVFIIVSLFNVLFLPHVNFWPLLILSIVTALFSIVGDLIVSLFKRIKGIKDTGKIFPGHGGVLDRIDSMLAALPIFCFAAFTMM